MSLIAESDVTSVSLRDGVYTYRVPDDALSHGTSLGNAHGWATSKGTGAIEGLFSTDIGKRVTGSMVVNFLASYRDLFRYWSEGQDASDEVPADTLISLPQVGQGTFQIHPAYQQHEFMLSGGVEVLDTFFLPRTGFDDDAVVIRIVNLTNNSEREQSLAVIGCLSLPGDTELDMESSYDSHAGGVLSWNKSDPDWVRFFGSIPHPDAFLVTHDLEEAWHPRYPLPNQAKATGETSASLQVVVFLRPGESKTVSFIMAFSPYGKKEALKIHERYRKPEKHLEETARYYADLISNSEVITPDSMINQGIQWSKANMIRVLAGYGTGISFTNEPGVSSNVVARDAAWFIYGSDYVLPEASCHLLNAFARYQNPNGLIPEYYDARNGRTEDYGLNINDDTPLFIMAAAHHVETTGHSPCRENLYSASKKAANYIISQQNGQGLVFCNARGTNVWGICSWRNVIENRSINGAVTEINCECYAALKAAARICRMMDDDDADYFDHQAEKLRDAINTHLKNPENGMYYLNIDVDGNIHTEVTADELFALITGVADEETQRLISTRLNNPDFMTSAGIRTSSALSPTYSPDRLVGLQGGVWPGVTWWYAFGASVASTALMVESLRKSYRQYIVNPRVYNTVPGQFSEWFDGESLANRGMRLSPWEPPRYLWAALEGMVGVQCDGETLKVVPKIPADWHWLSLRNLLYHEKKLSFFAARQSDGLHLYTVGGFGSSEAHVDVYENELTDLVEPSGTGTTMSAFSRGSEILICLGSLLDEKQPAAFLAHRLLDNARRYKVSAYLSETGDWNDFGSRYGSSLGRLSVEIEPKGFVLLLLKPA